MFYKKCALLLTVNYQNTKNNLQILLKIRYNDNIQMLFLTVTTQIIKYFIPIGIKLLGTSAFLPSRLKSSFQKVLGTESKFICWSSVVFSVHFSLLHHLKNDLVPRVKVFLIDCILQYHYSTQLTYIIIKHLQSLFVSPKIKSIQFH